MNLPLTNLKAAIRGRKSKLITATAKMKRMHL